MHPRLLALMFLLTSAACGAEDALPPAPVAGLDVPADAPSPEATYAVPARPPVVSWDRFTGTLWRGQAGKTVTLVFGAPGHADRFRAVGVSLRTSRIVYHVEGNWLLDYPVFALEDLIERLVPSLPVFVDTTDWHLATQVTRPFPPPNPVGGEPLLVLARLAFQLNTAPL